MIKKGRQYFTNFKEKLHILDAKGCEFDNDLSFSNEQREARRSSTELKVAVVALCVSCVIVCSKVVLINSKYNFWLLLNWFCNKWVVHRYKECFLGLLFGCLGDRYWGCSCVGGREEVNLNYPHFYHLAVPIPTWHILPLKIANLFYLCLLNSTQRKYMKLT